MAINLGLFVPTRERDYNRVPASIWIRALQMVPYYRALGLDVEINNPFRKYDIAIVFRQPSLAFYLLTWFLRKTCGRVYFDTVVNYFDEHEAASVRQVHYQKMICEKVFGLICSSDFIAQRGKVSCDNIHVMDDPIDLRHFNTIKERINYDFPVFGWSGVSCKAACLNRYRERIDNRMYLITDRQIEQRELSFSYRYKEWVYDEFPQDLLRCDLALLPREDVTGSYNAGHSCFKALAFAAQGVPVIANAIPSYRKLAGYFSGISFLEDHDYSVDRCIASLRSIAPPEVAALRNKYSCESQATALVEFLLT